MGINWNLLKKLLIIILRGRRHRAGGWVSRRSEKERRGRRGSNR